MQATSPYLPTPTNGFKWITYMLILSVPFIVYAYFSEWRTGTCYGDDLYIFKSHAEASTLSEKLNQPLVFGKYRPVHGIGIYLLIEMLEKNVTGYYIFNILVQSLNTVLLAVTLNLFLRNFVFSFMLALATGLSAFALFNITQLLNGGILEGLAMTFFLGALYFIIKVMYFATNSPDKTYKWLIWAIILSNLALYTHERYIALLLFLLIIIAIVPSLRPIPLKTRLTLLLFTVAGIVLNVLIKEWLYDMPFLMGTASTGIRFSFSTAFGFLGDAILSLFRWNAGPEFLIGVKFAALPIFNQVLIIIAGSIFILLLLRYLITRLRSLQNRPEQRIQFTNLVLLIILGALVLLPAVSTIRLEQRWLQAPFTIYILIFSIILADFLSNRWAVFRVFLFMLIPVIYIFSDFNYLRLGRTNFYLAQAETFAATFRKAIDDKTISPNSTELFIWENKIDENVNSSIRWSIGEGYLFDFYQGKSKKVSFIDSMYTRATPSSDTVITDFNEKEAQLLYLTTGYPPILVDATEDYLANPRRNFYVDPPEFTVPTGIVYNQAYMKVTNEGAKEFQVNGLHADEGGMSWTTGDTRFRFKGHYRLEDSLVILLKTYLPPACKNIVPALLLKAEGAGELKPLGMQREGDNFRYSFKVDKPTFVKEIRILADTIAATPPDTRRLSFPFISLELKR